MTTTKFNEILKVSHVQPERPLRTTSLRTPFIKHLSQVHIRMTRVGIGVSAEKNLGTI